MSPPPSSLIIWLKEWARLQTRRSWLEPRPVYVAAGLAVTVALLLLVVVSVTKPPAPSIDQAAVRPAAVSPLPPVGQESEAVAGSEPATAGEPTSEEPRRPVAGDVSLAFGWQLHPLYGDWRYHPGVDIAAAVASPVRAIWGGRVSEVIEDGRYGLTVVVTGGGHTVHYSSLAAARVDKGQAVAAGTVIGTAGQAKSEPYPHLHLSLQKGGDYIDPQAILSEAR